MLRQTLSRLVTNSKTPNELLNRTRVVRCNIPNIFMGTSAYCKNESERDRTDATPKQADRAVAIFEKITRTDALINLLAGEISSELRENIILNPDRNSKLRHIEVTADKIRLEYSQITPQFTKFASLMQANKQEQAQYPEFLVPTDAVNLTWCGGGATLVLSKRKTLHYLQQLKALHGTDEDKNE